MSKHSQYDKPTAEGYYTLYHWLIDEITNQKSWWGVVLVFYILIALGLFFYAVDSTIQILENPNIILSRMAFFVFSALGYGVGFGMFVGIITGFSDKKRTLNEISAYLLIVAPKPYKDGYGLSSSELSQLSEFAKIEQSAADWRGNILTFAVWGIILVVISRLRNFIPVDISISPVLVDSISFTPLQILMALVIGGVLILLLILLFTFSLSIAEYVAAFLGHERINRAILLACQESISILSSRSK